MESASGLAHSASFVLTLEMDGDSFGRFNALRQAHYPPERNLVPAHVTLFRKLPDERSREIKELLTLVASRQKPFSVGVREVKEMERGVAIFLDAPQLYALHAMLADEWEPWLDDHERFDFQPHVTIAANVAPGDARRIRNDIAATFRPPRMQGIGLHLWRYRDGPWQHERLFPFG
jgi:2'-5' RNA ligase